MSAIKRYLEDVAEGVSNAIDTEFTEEGKDFFDEFFIVREELDTCIDLWEEMDTSDKVFAILGNGDAEELFHFLLDFMYLETGKDMPLTRKACKDLLLPLILER